LEDLLEDKENVGELSPNRIAGAIQQERLGPTKAIGKTIL